MPVYDEHNRVPANNAKALGVAYALYGFLQSTPERTYKLDLADVGQRAILYLLLQVRDRVLTSGGTSKCALESLGDVDVNQLIQKNERGEWVVEAEHREEKLSRAMDPLARGDHGGSLIPESSVGLAGGSSGAGASTGARGGAVAVVDNAGCVVKFNFKITRSIEEFGGKDSEPLPPKAGVKRSDGFLAVKILDRIRDLTRITISFEAEVRVLHLWKNLSTCSSDVGVLLGALSMDFYLSYRLVDLMTTTTPQVLHRILFQLVGSLRGKAQARDTLLVKRTNRDVFKFRVYAGRYLHFSAENPTANYNLVLESPLDYAVGDSLMRLNDWELALRRASHEAPPLGWASLGQYGQLSNFRNETLNRVPFLMDKTFQLPTSGIFSCDYLSSRRPPPSATSLDPERFYRFLNAILVANCDVLSCRHTLLSVSDHFFLTARQVRDVLQIFLGRSVEIVHDLVVTFCTRTVDWYRNEKVIRAGIAPMCRRPVGIAASANSTATDSFGAGGAAAAADHVDQTTLDGAGATHDINSSRTAQPGMRYGTVSPNCSAKMSGTVGSFWDSQLVRRLGSVFLFPWVQPENHVWFLNFRAPEDRVAMKFLMQYEAQESGDNIEPMSWDIIDLSMGVSQSWVADPPDKGTLQVQYVCAPQSAVLDFRLRFAAIYGGWAVNMEDLEEEQRNITWWMSVLESPVPMLEMSIMLLHQFETLAEVGVGQ